MRRREQLGEEPRTVPDLQRRMVTGGESATRPGRIGGVGGAWPSGATGELGEGGVAPCSVVSCVCALACARARVGFYIFTIIKMGAHPIITLSYNFTR